MRKQKLIYSFLVGIAFSLGFTVLAFANGTLILSPSSTVIGVDGKGQVHAIFDDDGTGPDLPAVLADNLVTWSSDNTSVITVSNGGVLDGKASGTATITATYNSLSAVAQIKVAGKVTSHSLTTPADGRNRSYLVYEPASYDGSKHVPLVIDIHGGGGSSQNEMDNTMLIPISDAKGFLIAYPNGTGTGLQELARSLTWNGGGCCGYAMDNHVDDVSFISQAIDDIANHYAIDTKRVYAMGMSNGGIMTQRLACELSDRLAAVGPISGGINMSGDFTACNQKRLVPIMEFHGTTDENYPYNGGIGPKGIAGVNFYSIPKTINDWLARYNMSSVTTTYQKGIETCQTWEPALSTLKVILCTARPATPLQNSDGAFTEGGGHAQPGGSVAGYKGADFPTTDIYAASALWDFFSGYALPDAANTAPTASAGDNQTVALPAAASLKGTVTDDGLPNPPARVTVSWTMTSGPGSVQFADSTSAQTSATFSAPGTYVLTLTASDGALSSSANTQITVTGQQGDSGGSTSEPKAYPNPFRAKKDDAVTFSGLPANATLKMFNVGGKLIRRLVCDASGSTQWDAKDSSGHKVASGTYLGRTDGHDSVRVEVTVIR